MKLRLPLFAQVLVWFSLNLLLLGGLVFWVFRTQFRTEGLLAAMAGDRAQRIADGITGELKEQPVHEWSATLERFSKAYGVQFMVRREDGAPFAGPPEKLPLEVLNHFRGAGPVGPNRPDRQERGERIEPGFERAPGPGLGGGMNRGSLPGLAQARRGPPPRVFVETKNPTRYWAIFGFMVRSEFGPRANPYRLVLSSTSMSGNGLFFDPSPWLLGLLLMLLLSALWWAPFVRGITRSISEMKEATEQIASGRFDVPIKSRRRDELGKLGDAIDQLALRLGGFISGQKRFLGDTAHELCAPIARLQMALGVLEQRADAEHQSQIADLREELDEMSSLVNELLSFSKAGLRGREIALEPVPLADMVKRAAKREACHPDRLAISVPDQALVFAEPELLARAIGNVLRNALRHGGAEGKIHISAQESEEQVQLQIGDEGPGVPEGNLQKIFDPFFRLDVSRTRDTGGFGLGLAIVKSCIEACKGTVLARNRKPRGLEVELTLLRAG